jgi:hypothetical protein
VPRSVEAPLDTHAACVTGTLNVLDASARPTCPPPSRPMGPPSWRPSITARRARRLTGSRPFASATSTSLAPGRIPAAHIPG